MSNDFRRRGFLARAGAVLGAVSVGFPSISYAGAVDDDSEHDAWMKPLKGKHRQFFHAIDVNERAMLMSNNFLDAYQDSFGAKPGEVNAVIGVHGPALAIGFTDAAWSKYELGKTFNVLDPATKEPSRRNAFATGGPLAVSTLQGRGVVFLMCNTALRATSRALATARGETPEAVYADLAASRLPNTILVPAMVIAINRAQEAGFTYLRV